MNKYLIIKSKVWDIKKCHPVFRKVAADGVRWR